MKDVIQAAAEAQVELRERPLPTNRPKTRQLAEIVGKQLHQTGIRNENDPFWIFWKKVQALHGLEMSCVADISFWVHGFTAEASELAVVHPEGALEAARKVVPESERVGLVLRMCDAIGAAANE